MYKRTISYTDYDGNERTEDFYFHFTEAELTEMELSVTGGLKAMLERIINTQDTPKLVKIFKDLLFKSYGEKSLDGRRFIKSKELSEAFSQTEAYSMLFMELATDDKKAAEFVNGVLPADLRAKVEEQQKQELASISEIKPAE